VNHPFFPNKIVIFFCAALIAVAADDRIRQPVDPSRTAVVPGQVHPRARPQFDRGAVDSSFPINYATLLLTPAPGLEAFLADQQNPASANYRRWITPGQFADQFGLTASDIGKVTAWLQSEGLSVNDVARGRHWITFSGPAARVSAALHTEFHRYLVNGETHFSNSRDPSVPAALSGVVAGFAGLNDFRLKPAVMTAKYDLSGANYLAPEDIATIYDVAPLYQAGVSGSGQKIAIVGQTDINSLDIRSFRKKFNLPLNDPQLLLVGPDPGLSPSDLVEADLDLEWSGGIAPAATIIYVYSFDVGVSAEYAVDGNVAPVISMSYGGCELANSPALRTVAQQANAQGITWIAASGDSGATACDMDSPTPQASLGLTASFPASIPEITGVGATQLSEGSGTYWSATNDANSGSALSYIPEIAWNGSALRHEIAATGGAASQFFSKPVWQAGAGVPNDNARDVPDVAFAGSPDHDAYVIVTGGATEFVGGTSAPTPVFAAVLALLNQSLTAQGVLSQPGLGNVNPLLYRLAQSTSDVFHDVTIGNNQIPCQQESPSCVDGLAGYLAGPGYDLTIGLGSMDVAHLVAEWNNGTASTTTVSANPTNFNLTDFVQLTATVSGAGAAQPTGTVAFIAADISLGIATLTGGAASLNASGILIAPSTGTVTALYSGDAVYNPSAGTAMVTLNLPSSGSLVVPAVSPNPVNQAVDEWPYTVALVEKAGVSTKLTGFTINGVSQDLAYWSSTSIPAKGVVSASLVASGITPPLTRDFHFTGVDANGTTWSRDLIVPFLGPAGPPFVPSFTLTTVAAVPQNPQAGATCAWSQQLTVQETSGFTFLLTGLSAGNADLNNSIQALFGTTRLAPYGTLEGTICWTAGSGPANVSYQLSAESEIGTTLTVKSSASLLAPVAQPGAMAVSPAVVEMLAANSSEAGSATVNLNFTGGPPNWALTIVPARASSWLKVSPLSGEGSTQLNLQASAAGLSNGVYDATLLIASPGSIPEVSSVRVVFVVGASSALTIDSVANAASGAPALAPGAMAVVNGSNLAASSQGTGKLPLALSLGGVSATVNGITAPLYSTAPDSLTIQIPYESGAGTAVLGVNNNGLITSYIFQVSVAAPAFFTTPDGFLTPDATAQQGQTVTAFVTGEGDVSPFLATGATPPTGTPLKELPQPILPYTLTVGGVIAPITFIGVPVGLAGVTQINFTVPASVPVGTQAVVLGLELFGCIQSGSGSGCSGALPTGGPVIVLGGFSPSGTASLMVTGQ
jgi:uncharacterized protein (TIGR03437 family)